MSSYLTEMNSKAINTASKTRITIYHFYRKLFLNHANVRIQPNEGLFQRF